MLLAYTYKNHDYEVSIQWTTDTECSTVFQDIALKITDKHQLNSNCYHELAKELDELYEQFRLFNDEHFDVILRVICCCVLFSIDFFSQIYFHSSRDYLQHRA